ncbi:MAG: arylsulfatase [Akkermansiaceae bacterium]|jgi:arylsulfatase A-like enzyme|nr:arylsulfatase [Akkermansiaceae bacterium]MDP4897106.1 arylsulfatase [Akkermansiaceae bacterium]
MNRLLIPLLAAAIIAKNGNCMAAESGSRPNVILIVTDDQGYGDMACHGNPWLKTPNLDKLHSQSVCLENYHVDPFCTPTRAALLTGHYSLRTGAWSVTQGRQLLHRDEVTMADVFAASGYQTAMFGKWHLGDPWPYAPQYRGFQETVCHLAGGVDEIGNPTGNDYFDDTYFRNGKPEKFKGYCTDVWFDETLNYIRKYDQTADAKPFFIYLPTNAMHSPFTVAERYSAPFRAMGHPENRAKFFGMITNFDENLGRLMSVLHDSKQEYNTILIFMSDNGTAEGVPREPDYKPGFNAEMRGNKGSIYDGGHRVACFVRWPQHFEAGKQVNGLTAHIDWLPTLIDLCGLKAPENVKLDGRSIKPLLEGDSPTWTDRTIFVERQADELKKWNAPSTNPNFLPQMAVLTDRWRLVNGELYDIKADPEQTQNIADLHPEVVKSLIVAHGTWYDEVITDHKDYTRFVIGAPEENPTQFTIRDWHPEQGSVIWHPSQLSDDNLFINGFWAIDVTRSGRYEIRLSRHPKDKEKPMLASEARLSIGEQNLTKIISADASSVTFELELPASPTLLRTGLKDEKTSKERGAYFVNARWLDDRQ